MTTVVERSGSHWPTHWIAAKAALIIVLRVQHARYHQDKMRHPGITCGGPVPKLPAFGW